MANAAQPNHSVNPTVSANDLTEKQIRINRGLRTLENDIAEAKKSGGSTQAPVQKPQASVVKNIPSKHPAAPQHIPQKPLAAGEVVKHPAPTLEQKTHYSKELERLAQKYIPEKKPAEATPTKTAPSGDALKSFEMNKAFNDQLHKTPVLEKKTDVGSTLPKSDTTVSIQHALTPTVKKTEALVQEPKEKPISSPTLETEPTNKFADITEEDITAELDRVLKVNKEKHEEYVQPVETKKESIETPKTTELPHSSIKELEETLSEITKKIQSSNSRVETHRDNEREVLASLKNLFERRDIINKNLDPIKEKERAVEGAIKALEERETSATNKLEKRDAENKRWERESERRELEDERWRLEEIFEKLRFVIEKTEYEHVSIKKKLDEEEKYKHTIEAEKEAAETHLNLLTKRDEKEKVEKKREQTQNQITNLKNELVVIRSTEEGFEKRKQELETKIGALSDISSRRSLEEERRDVEDERHDTEEKRWAREDELKKYYAEKDERDREITILSAELDSLQSRFEELERTKESSFREDSH